jgi:signal transduction histidine kinase
VVPVEVSCSVMRLDGKAVGIQGIARDMTERHRLDQELRRLHAQDRRRVDQLTTLNEMGRKIAALQPVDEMLPHLATMLGKTFGYYYVRILLVDEDDDLATAAAWGPAVGDEGEGGASPLALRALRGDAGFVAGSGRPEDDAAVRYTEVAVPIRTKSEVVGVLDIRGAAESGLDESDIYTLQTLADQVAVAIENARLFEAGQQLAVSEERNRLARELHDSVTQELFSMTMITGALPTLQEKKPEVAKERVQRLHELARGALAEMRALLFALRPAALAEEGLVVALQKHAAAIEAREGLAVHLEVEGAGRLPQPCEEALFRVFQEALNNVVKHARAENVWVDLATGDDATSLTIRDDGIGLAATAQPAGVQTMGMRSMRERVAALGGTFEVESAPEQGTTVRASVPVGCEQPVHT